MSLFFPARAPSRFFRAIARSPRNIKTSASLSAARLNSPGRLVDQVKIAFTGEFLFGCLVPLSYRDQDFNPGDFRIGLPADENQRTPGLLLGRFSLLPVDQDILALQDVPGCRGGERAQ